MGPSLHLKVNLTAHKTLLGSPNTAPLPPFALPPFALPILTLGLSEEVRPETSGLKHLGTCLQRRGWVQETKWIPESLHEGHCP